jgi:succinate-semialdehyde dehydrogenase/glutarate-semialdehyde dehydrogenase
MAHTQMYIDGRWTGASGGGKLEVINPATEEAVDVVEYGGRAEASAALDAAQRAFETWKKATAWQRGEFLKKAADLLRERADDIARTMTMEQGKPLAEAKGETMVSAMTFEWFAEEGKRVEGRWAQTMDPLKRYLTMKQPIGVCAAISPWNFPLVLQARKIAASLAAGCTVVARPASQTPLSLIKMFECFEDVGLPPGVANLVMGPPAEIVDEFMENPICRKISFTGSTEVGKELMRRAADGVKRVSLELGGHAPVLIFDDVDPEQAARTAVTGKFRNNGQVCISPTRFYIHESRRKAFTEAAVEFARKLKLGNGLDEGVEIGPMFEPKALEKTKRLVDQAVKVGANVLAGGSRSTRFDKGYFFEPTVLDNLGTKADILTEEPFAPIMPILSFEQIDEAIAKANDTIYGLAAYVMTNDLTTAIRMAEGLEYGIIGINDPVPAAVQSPFGGMKQSGIGRENSHEGIEPYLETKSVSFMLKS